MIDEDKAACLLYIRVPFKDPGKGYALVSIVSEPVRSDGHLDNLFSILDGVSSRGAHYRITFSRFIISQSNA